MKLDAVTRSHGQKSRPPAIGLTSPDAGMLDGRCWGIVSFSELRRCSAFDTAFPFLHSMREQRPTYLADLRATAQQHRFIQLTSENLQNVDRALFAADG
jgi:hypothetical protein